MGFFSVAVLGFVLRNYKDLTPSPFHDCNFVVSNALWTVLLNPESQL